MAHSSHSSLDRFALALVPLLVWWLRQSGTQEVLCQRKDRLESAKECFRAACSEVDVFHTWQVCPILACAPSSAVIATSDAAIGDVNLVSLLFPHGNFQSAGIVPCMKLPGLCHIAGWCVG